MSHLSPTTSWFFGVCVSVSSACVGQVGRVLICLTANLQRSGPMDQTVQ